PVERARKPVRQGRHGPGPPGRQHETAPAVQAAHNPTRYAVRRLPPGPAGRPAHLSPGNHRELADRSPGTRRPYPNTRPPDLVSQTLHQAIQCVLACYINHRIRDPDKAEDRGDLEDLAGPPWFHVSNRFLAQVDHCEEIQLDDPSDRLRILV